MTTGARLGLGRFQDRADHHVFDAIERRHRVVVRPRVGEHFFQGGEHRVSLEHSRPRSCSLASIASTSRRSRRPSRRSCSWPAPRPGRRPRRPLRPDRRSAAAESARCTRCWSFSRASRAISVLIMPGATALTWMPCGATSRASEMVNVTTPGLRRRVVGVAGGRAVKGGLRDDVHDPPAAAGGQPAPHRLAAGEERAGQVHGQRGVPLLLGHVLDVGRGPDAGVVHQDVDRAERLSRSGRTSAARRPPSTRRRARPGRRPCTCGGFPWPVPSASADEIDASGQVAEVVDRHLGPFGGQRQADRPPQPPRAAGHDRHFVAELQIHVAMYTRRGGRFQVGVKVDGPREQLVR